MSTGEPRRSEPEFTGDAFRSFAREWVAYGRVAFFMTVSPRAFVRAWLDDPRSALNPIAATLQSVAILAAWSAACFRILRPELNVPWWIDAFFPVAQLLSVVVVGIALHLPLKLLGAEGRLRTTVGVLLYLTAGPLLLMRIVSTPLACWLMAQRSFIYALAGATSIVTVIYYVLTMSVAHRISWWRVLVAIVIGIVAIGIVSVLAASILAHFHHFKSHAPARA